MSFEFYWITSLIAFIIYLLILYYIISSATRSKNIENLSKAQTELLQETNILLQIIIEQNNNPAIDSKISSTEPIDLNNPETLDKLLKLLPQKKN